MRWREKILRMIMIVNRNCEERQVEKKGNGPVRSQHLFCGQLQSLRATSILAGNFHRRAIVVYELTLETGRGHVLPTVKVRRDAACWSL